MPPLSPLLRGGVDAVRLARAYFAVQAVAGGMWWIGVFASPAVRRATLGDLDPVIISAVDIPFFVLASALVAAGVRAAVWAAVPWTVLATAGMVLYATLTREAGWGALLMLAAAAGSVAAAVVLRLSRVPTEWIIQGPFVFRTARADGRMRLLAQTGLQILVFWTLFLALIPAVIAWVEHRWRLHLAVPAPVAVTGIALVVAASALGLWSAHTMSTLGDGTPLPSALPRRLVIAGPYRWVRNPMAIAGIAQGIAVGMIAGSWLVVVYAICGSLVWNWIIRPHEEADLAARFGADFERYRDEVACWIPRRPQGRAVSST